MEATQDPLPDPDPRGPLRTIVAVRKDARDAHVTLSCGHVRPLNVLYMYPIGDSCRCFTCRQVPA